MIIINRGALVKIIEKSIKHYRCCSGVSTNFSGGDSLHVRFIFLFWREMLSIWFYHRDRWILMELSLFFIKVQLLLLLVQPLGGLWISAITALPMQLCVIFARRLWKRLKDFHLKYIDSHPYGDIVKPYCADADEFWWSVNGIYSAFSGVLTIAGTLIFMLTINIPMTAAVVVLILISFLWASLLRRHFICSRSNSKD